MIALVHMRLTLESRGAQSHKFQGSIPWNCVCPVYVSLFLVCLLNSLAWISRKRHPNRLPWVLNILV